MGEHEILVARNSVRFDQPSSSPASRSAIGTERRGRQVGLAVVGVLAAHERVARPDPLCDPVDVAPAQPEQLGLAQPRHRGSEDHAHAAPGRAHPVEAAATGPAPFAGRLRLPDRRLRRGSPAAPRRAPRPSGTAGRDRRRRRAGDRASRAPHGVLAHPAAVDRVLEDRVRESSTRCERVFGESSFLEHRGGDRFDVGPGHVGYG